MGLQKKELGREMNEQITNLSTGHHLQHAGVAQLARGKSPMGTFVENDEVFVCSLFDQLSSRDRDREN